MEEEIVGTQETVSEDYFNFNVLVKDKKTIPAKVRVTRGFDPVNNVAKPIFYRVSLLENKINIIDLLIKDIDEKIQLAESDDEVSEEIIKAKKEVNVLYARKNNLDSEKMRYTQLLEQPYREWTAEFKSPDLAESIAIEARSFTEDPFGDKSEFNDFENIRAKIDLLLISWDVKNQGKPVPIKEAMKCDPDLLKAFSEEYDLQVNGYVFDERKK